MGEKGAAEEEGAAGLPLPLGSAAPVAPGLPVQRPAVPGLQAPCWLPPGTPSHLQGSPARAAAACRTGRGRRGHVQASVLWLGDRSHGPFKVYPPPVSSLPLHHPCSCRGDHYKNENLTTSNSSASHQPQKRAYASHPKVFTTYCFSNLLLLS